MSFAADQRRQEAQRQIGEPPHVDVDHGELIVKRQFGRRPVQAVAGIVDDHVRHKLAPLQLLGQRRPGAGIAEVEGRSAGRRPRTCW
jgi:hypothetical protein